MGFGQFYPSPNQPNPTVPAPYPYGIPPRIARLEDDSPRPHASLMLAKTLVPRNILTQLESFYGPQCGDDGDNPLYTILFPTWLQAATDYFCKECRTSFDWTYRILFDSGPGSPVIVLPDKNIRDVLKCYIRVLPSNLWYAFSRFRKADGTEFFAIGGVVEQPIQPETLPVLDPIAAATTGQLFYTPTGIEDADLLVDTRRRTIKVPPRVLYAGVSVPLWNYTFNPGILNIETHYTYGYVPTKYLNGQPLTYNSTTGIVNNVAQIDWASGIPSGIQLAVAQVAANQALRAYSRAMSEGVSSLSVDGASESYGSAPFGGDLTAQDTEILDKQTALYAIQMVL